MIYFNSIIGYFIILAGCTLGAASVESLLLQWVCLEVNMLCIIPVILGRSREDSIISGVKYFISQRSASVVFLTSTIMGRVIENIMILGRLSIIFKLGVPPFHSWILGIIMNINLNELVLLLTVQKFIPLIILSQLGLRDAIMMVLILLRGAQIVVRANSNFSFRYILFLSSVRNGIWIVVSLLRGVWFTFLLLYSAILMGLVAVLISGKIIKFRDVAFRDPVKKMRVAIYFLNLGGVPPLMGFAVKLIVIKSLVDVRMISVFILITLSVIVLYVYTRMMYQAYTISPNPTFNINSNRPGRFVLIRVPLILSMRILSWIAL